MNDLEHESRRLLIAARDEYDNEPVDAQRILSAVLAKANAAKATSVGAASGQSAHTHAASKAGLSFGAKLFLGAVVLAALTSSAYFALRSTGAPAPERQASERTSAAVSPANPIVTASHAPNTTSAAAPSQRVPEPLAADPAADPHTRIVQARSEDPSEDPSADDLRMEARMLLDARNALRANDGNRALELLHEAHRQFPRGALREEADATRILALCALSRTDEAIRLRERFVRTFPGSPLLERVTHSCAGAAVAP